jgi:hypothetical protein
MVFGENREIHCSSPPRDARPHRPLGDPQGRRRVRQSRVRHSRTWPHRAAAGRPPAESKGAPAWLGFQPRPQRRVTPPPRVSTGRRRPQPGRSRTSCRSGPSGSHAFRRGRSSPRVTAPGRRRAEQRPGGRSPGSGMPPPSTCSPTGRGRRRPGPVAPMRTHRLPDQLQPPGRNPGPQTGSPDPRPPPPPTGTSAANPCHRSRRSAPAARPPAVDRKIRSGRIDGCPVRID